MTNDDLLKGTTLQKVADKGSAIYAKIKAEFESKEHGKFIAIEPESGKYYLGNTGAEALEKARKKHLGKLFYIVKIGFESAETLAHSLLGNS